MKSPCCMKQCLRTRLSFNQAMTLVQGCLDEVKSSSNLYGAVYSSDN